MEDAAAGNGPRPYDRPLVERVLREAQTMVAGEIDRLLLRNRHSGYGPLYDQVSDYPMREGKSLRPAICIAACRAAGGYLDQARLSATALELLHNAFLTHDDVVDGSLSRRGAPTTLLTHGAATAVNVGDATQVLALQVLLENTQVIGVRKALLVLQEVERMARESVEGQAIELDWIAREVFDLVDRDYIRMAYKKTCWYTVIAPLRIGLICGHPQASGAPLEDELVPLIELGHLAGIAFQVSDDLLNLEADEVVYGKEIAGDLWEGKRTVMLLHFLRSAAPPTHRRAVEILRTPRSEKRAEDVSWLLAAMREYGSLDYGRAFARDYSTRAIAVDEGLSQLFQENDDRRFLREMLRYVIERVK